MNETRSGGSVEVTDTDFDVIESTGVIDLTDGASATKADSSATPNPNALTPEAQPDEVDSGRRLLAVSVVAFLVAFAMANVALFVRAQGSPSRPADVAVILNGGDGERLDTALQIVDRGVVPLLVISHGVDGAWVPAERVCSLDRSIDVICPSPELLTTRGEAEMMADLVEENGWERVDVVTSSYHGPRARILFNRCIEDAEIHVVSVRPEIGAVSWMKRIVHEWGGIVQAMGESTCG